MAILKTTPNHIPLKYGCSIKMNTRIRPTYINASPAANKTNLNLQEKNWTDWMKNVKSWTNLLEDTNCGAAAEGEMTHLQHGQDMANDEENWN